MLKVQVTAIEEIKKISFNFHSYENIIKYFKKIKLKLI